MSDMDKQLAKLERDMLNMALKVNKKIQTKAMKILAIKVTNDAKDILTINENVVTGLLRKSIIYRMENAGAISSAIVGTNVEYAPFVEFGTSRSKAYPYLTKSLNNNRANILTAVRTAILEVTK
jgi:HK97 gp10 family phage protein